MNRPLIVLFLLLAVTGSQAATSAGARGLVEESRAAVRNQPERSRDLAEQALAELAAQPRPDVDLQIAAHWLLCDYNAERDRTLARTHLDAARKLLPRATDPTLAAQLLGCEGQLSELGGDSARALALFDQAVGVAESAHRDETLADALFERGYVHGVLGQLTDGLGDLRRSIELYSRAGLTQQAANGLNAVGVVYDRMGDHTQALHYFEATLKAQEGAGLLREQAVTQHNMGRTLQNLGDLAAARGAFTNAMALSRRISFPRGEAYALRGLASVANAEGDGRTAMQLLDQASTLLARVPDERLRAQISLQRGVALRLVDRLPDSLAALSEARAVFETADSQSETATTLGELATTQAALGNYQAAYALASQFKSVSDRLLYSQIQERFTSLKGEFDLAASNRENALLKRENAATERALAQERRVSTLREVILALGGMLVLVLAALVYRHRRTSRRMEGLAMTDELTRLWNRRHVLGALQARLASGKPCAILIADIDLFKPVNDEHGHIVGDHILRAVSEALQSAVPAHAEVGRMGGEEFIAVLPGLGFEAALAAAEKLRAAVAAVDVSAWLPDRNVTISIGFTVSRVPDDLSAVLRRADEALYDAKRSGRNCVRGTDAAPVPAQVTIGRIAVASGQS
jgi:diguanylate cyclase (GGDEF)-like protein